jgi:hypothetical protein
MKRISWIAAIFILVSIPCTSSWAQDKPDFLRTPESSRLLDSLGDTARPLIEPGIVEIGGAEIDQLLSARTGAVLRLPSFDEFTGNLEEPLAFRRVNLFAKGARIQLLSEFESVTVEPEPRHFFLATNSTTGIGLAVDPESGKVSGYAIKGGAGLEIAGDLAGVVEFQPDATMDEATAECGTELGDQPHDALAFLDDPIGPSRSDAPAGGSIDFQPVIAIDTDSEWLAGFADDTDAANDWITNLFLVMNVMFERDLGAQLMIGDVILRTGSDPYNVTSGDRFDQLTEFGQYWRLNQDGSDRDFAAMLSGRNINPNSFSGIAWLNQYCQNGWVAGGQGFTVGSYSYNAIGSNWPASAAAQFVGHEIGHNMGSPHTHCYNPAIDQCYGSESDCYSGPASCPGGPGTAMSYCHLLGGCGSTADFHPTVQALLEDRLASNSPACIAPYDGGTGGEAPIFEGGFEGS